MKQFISAFIFFLFCNNLFSSESYQHTNFYTNSGDHLIANLIKMQNDTIYASYVDSNQIITRAIHKSIFSKVIFSTGEYLNLEKSNYPYKENISWNTLGEELPRNNTSSITQKIPVAVINFEGRGNIPESDAISISDRFREKLIGTDKYKVMERNEMDFILKEQGFQQSGACKDNGCLVEIGQLIAVEKIVTGSINKTGNIYTLSAKLLDVKTGQIEISESEDCDCSIEEVLTISVHKLSRKLAKLPIRKNNNEVIVKKGDSRIFIKSNPDKAIVYLDGKRQDGLTPLTIKNVVPGDHVLTLRKTIGNIEYQKQTNIKTTSNELTKVSENLEQKKSTIYIASNPPEAELYINKKPSINRFPKAKTPAIIKNIKDSDVQIHFFKPGYIDTSINISIKNFSNNEFNVTLKENIDKNFIINQNKFKKERLTRRISLVSFSLSAVGVAATSYFAYYANYHKEEAEKQLDLLKDPDIRNNPSAYNDAVRKNSENFYDYRYNYKAFLAALGGSIAMLGISFTLFF